MSWFSTQPKSSVRRWQKLFTSNGGIIIPQKEVVQDGERSVETLIWQSGFPDRKNISNVNEKDVDGVSGFPYSPACQEKPTPSQETDMTDTFHLRVTNNVQSLLTHSNVRVPDVKAALARLNVRCVNDLPESDETENRFYNLCREYAKQRQADERIVKDEKLIEAYDRARAAREAAKAKEKDETDNLYKELTGKTYKPCPPWKRIDTGINVSKAIGEEIHKRADQLRKEWMPTWPEKFPSAIKGMGADFFVFDEAQEIDKTVFFDLETRSGGLNFNQHQEKNMCDNAELENAKTGAEILAAIEAGLQGTIKSTLYSTLRVSTTMIRKRKAWAAAREAQIKKLEELQADLVKKFDTSVLTKADIKAAQKLISELENERVSDSEDVF